MSAMIDALKKAKLISPKKAEWAERQARQRDQITQKLVRAKVDPEEARRLAKVVNETEIKKKEGKKYAERRAKRREKKKQQGQSK